MQVITNTQKFELLADTLTAHKLTDTQFELLAQYEQEFEQLITSPNR